jgi:hypothetical protein
MKNKKIKTMDQLGMPYMSHAILGKDFYHGASSSFNCVFTQTIISHTFYCFNDQLGPIP